jgi:hypothetical protein
LGATGIERFAAHEIGKEPAIGQLQTLMNKLLVELPPNYNMEYNEDQASLEVNGGARMRSLPL